MVKEKKKDDILDSRTNYFDTTQCGSKATKGTKRRVQYAGTNSLFIVMISWAVMFKYTNDAQLGLQTK